MNSLPAPIRLQRSLWFVAQDQIVFAWQGLQSAIEAYRERQAAFAAERELAQLDWRTLQDIGAPQGLVGQRRWQDEAASSERERLLATRGW